MDTEDQEPIKLDSQNEDSDFNDNSKKLLVGNYPVYSRKEKNYPSKIVSQDYELSFKGKQKNTQVPKEPFFPAELCRNLQDQVEALTEENTKLRKNVEAAEVKARTIISPLKGIGRASDLAANKIVELSKKVRELNAELASAHNRARTAEFKLATAEQAALEKEVSSDNSEAVDGSGDASNEVKELTDKLNASNAKLCEARNQVQQLKHEIKLAQKVLASEVGDGGGAGTLAPGWRGRAQQILALQAKVQELTERLSRANSPPADKASLAAQVAARQADRGRQAEHQKEVDGLREELEESRKKAEAGRARIRVIASELTALKARAATMADKSSHDDQLISALTGQLAAASDKARERELLLNRKFEEQITSLKQELSQGKIKISELHNIISERDTKIVRLEEKLSNAQNTIRNEAMANDYRPYSRGSSFERTASVYSHSQDIISQASEAERMRLMELLTVTNRRLEDERHALYKTQELLRVERHKRAKMETKLGRLELEKAGCSRGTGYKKPKPKTHSQAEWDALKDKAELLEEKCLTLETRLECLRQEKEEDSRRYLSLVEEARQSFFEHIKRTSST